MSFEKHRTTEQEIDEQLLETFPASDPPSWTLGHDSDRDFMKAMVINSYGGPEQLHYENVPIPEVNEGEILVKVLGASVNPIDCKLASGALRPVMNNMAVALPWIPGCDFCGIIEAVGKDILEFKKGDEVYGNCPSGGAYAQYVKVKAEWISPKPLRLEFLQAAVVPVAGLTAWQGLFNYGCLEKGQTVLIHGGAGGVGSFAIQLACWKNARVIATGSFDHLEYLKELGADEVVDYKAVAFETIAKNVDLVLDLVGGETQQRSFKVIKPGGVLVSTISPPSPEVIKEYKINALMMTMKPLPEHLKKMTELIMEGEIKTHVSKVYYLTEAQEAWSDVLSHHTKGKIVLEVS